MLCASSFANTCVRVELAGVSHEVTQDVGVPGLSLHKSHFEPQAADPATSQLTWLVKTIRRVCRPASILSSLQVLFARCCRPVSPFLLPVPDSWNSTFFEADDELASSGLRVRGNGFAVCVGSHLHFARSTEQRGHALCREAASWLLLTALSPL